MTGNRVCGFLRVVGAIAAVACAGVLTLQLRVDFGPSVAQQVPGRFDASLTSGKWAVYQLTGQSSGHSAGGFSVSISRQQSPTLTSSMIGVVAPDRRRLLVAPWPGDNVETVEKNSRIYTAVASFDAPAAGSYALTIGGRGRGYVLVARPLLSLVRVALPWLAGIAAGIMCFAGAGIILIWRHRPSAARAAQGPAMISQS
jgi:hypothetical protein